MVFYRYNPTARYIDEGIVTRTNLGSDLSIAKRQANEFNKLIDAFLQQESAIVSVQNNPTVQGLADEYLLSSDFNMLAEKSKQDYQYFIKNMLCTNVDGRPLSRIYLTGLSFIEPPGLTASNFPYNLSDNLISGVLPTSIIQFPLLFF